MTWFNGWYGNWNQPEGVVRIGGSFNKKEIFDKAQEIADRKNVTVTIRSEKGSYKGLEHDYFYVKPTHR